MVGLTNRIKGLFLGSVVFAVIFIGYNTPLTAFIAGFVIFGLYVGWADEHYGKKAAKAREAEIVAEETLRHRVRQELEEPSRPQPGSVVLHAAPDIAMRPRRTRKGSIVLFLSPILALGGLAGLAVVLSLFTSGQM